MKENETFVGQERDASDNSLAGGDFHAPVDRWYRDKELHYRDETSENVVAWKEVADPAGAFDTAEWELVLGMPHLFGGNVKEARLFTSAHETIDAERQLADTAQGVKGN